MRRLSIAIGLVFLLTLCFSTLIRPLVAADDGWKVCAAENGSCRFEGPHEVRYGADTHFIYRIVAGTVQCNNDAFGDPVYGTPKQCYARLFSSAPPPRADGMATLAAAACDTSCIVSLVLRSRGGDFSSIKGSQDTPVSNRAASWETTAVLPFSGSICSVQYKRFSHYYYCTLGPVPRKEADALFQDIRNAFRRGLPAGREVQANDDENPLVDADAYKNEYHAEFPNEDRPRISVLEWDTEEGYEIDVYVHSNVE